MNWLDLGIILCVLIFLIVGFKRGFMTSLLSSFSFKINAILSFFLCRPIASILNKIFNLESSIASSYAARLSAASPDFSVNLLDIPSEELSSFISNTIDKSGLSTFTNRLTNLFLNKDSLYTTLHDSGHTSRTLSDIISSAFGNFFLTIISFITSIILIYLIVLLLRVITNKLRTIGFVKAVDNTFGLLYGLFQCFIVLVILSFIIKLLSALSFMQGVTTYINSSAVGNFIYGQINSFVDNYLNFGSLFNSMFK